MPRPSTTWIHVGPAKSGTKTIQKNLGSFRDELLARGFLYPEFGVAKDTAFAKGPYFHQFLAQALTDGAHDLVRAYFAALPPAPDTFVSSEGFMKCTPAQFEVLRSAAAQRGAVKALYYVRDPVGRANSQAQQFIKTGKRSYAELAAEDRPVVSLKRQIKLLTKAFGADAVVIRKFARSAFPNGDLLHDVFTAIDRPDLIGTFETWNFNESMSLEAAMKVDAHRAATGDSSVIAADDPRFAGGNTKFTLPEEALARLRAKTRADLDWLAETYRISF